MAMSSCTEDADGEGTWWAERGVIARLKFMPACNKYMFEARYPI